MDYGLIVDLETTGLDANKDRVIEIGICEFGWSAGSDPTLLGMYGALQDPGIALPPEIVQLTGLTDAALKGHEINWDIVLAAWNRASVIVAHNAQFDRGFLQNIPALKGQVKHWACSVRHIDWDAKGFGTRKLTYLAAEHGFVNPFAHRAVFDCATTFRLVQPHMQELITNSFEPEVKFIAAGSPFESKDILKANHYRWDAEQRVWHKTVINKRADAERQFLAEKVYKGTPRHVEESIWFNSPSPSQP